MRKYIDSSVAIRDICEWATNLNNPKMLVREDVIGILENIPAADVRPAVRGRWIKHNATHVQKGGMYLECSCCHEYITVLGHVFDYCPNCGADMREPPKEKT